jgi:hypothetical protein
VLAMHIFPTLLQAWLPPPTTVFDVLQPTNADSSGLPRTSTSSSGLDHGLFSVPMSFSISRFSLRLMAFGYPDAICRYPFTAVTWHKMYTDCP